MPWLLPWRCISRCWRAAGEIDLPQDQFPNTQADLDQITNYVEGFDLPKLKASSALTLELKTAWVDASTVDVKAPPLATDLISSLAASRADIVMLDSSVVASDADRYPRSDGIHLDALGAAAFVLDVIGPALLGPSR